MPLRAERCDRRAGARLRRIEEGGEAGEDQVALVADRRRGSWSAGTARQAMPSTRKPSAPKRLEVRRRTRRRVASSSGAAVGSAGSFVSAGQPQHVLRRALDDQQARGPSCSTSTETRRRSKSNGTSSIFVQPATSIAACCEDRLVERALHAALEMAVELGELEHALAVARRASRCAASSAIFASVSVPVLSVHSTSMLPRSWIAARRFTITCLLGHAQRAAGQRHRHDHRQQLGRQPDRQRQREQQATPAAAGGTAVFTSSTNSTSSTVSRMISMPNCVDALLEGGRAAAA